VEKSDSRGYGPVALGIRDDTLARLLAILEAEEL
jgi:hypothetical protein